MTTTRMTFGSVLGTVTSAATTITKTLDTASTAVGMLTSFVEKAAAEQSDRYAIEKLTSRHRIIEEAATEKLQRAERLKTVAGKSDWHKQTLEAAIREFSAVFEPEQ